MKIKTRQRLAAGVVMALCIAGSICLLRQAKEPARTASAQPAAKTHAAGARALPPLEEENRLPSTGEKSAGKWRGGQQALEVVAPSVSADSNAPKSGATLKNAVIVNVGEILPALSQPEADWSKYAPELLTLAYPSGRIIDYAMTSVRDEHDRTIWTGRSDANDATAFLVTVSTPDTWYAETVDPDTGNDVVYYITAAGAQRTVTEPIRASCGVASPLSTAAASHAPDAQEHPDAPALVNSSDITVAAASTRSVDVLFFYDKAALDQASGSADLVKSRILGHLESSNLALGNSDVGAFRWRFAGLYQIPAYDSEEDPDPAGALSAISSGQGAIGSYVHRLAQYYSADQVVLYFGKRDDSVAGIAECPGHHAAVYYGSNYATLAHEMGHNFGCYHDRDEPSAGGEDGDGYYNYGHLFTLTATSGTTSGTYGTIMSYAGTIAYPGSRRIDNFSNPSVAYYGVPTGLPEGDPRAADNARFLREGAAAMADYRSAPATIPFISTHPRSGHYAVDASITLSVAVRGDQIFYQWKKGGKAIDGATDAEYKIDSAQESHAGRYTVTVSNIKGSVTSNEAVIGVGGNNGWGWGYGTGESDLGGDDVSGGGGAPGLYYLSALLMLALFRRAFARGSRK